MVLLHVCKNSSQLHRKTAEFVERHIAPSQNKSPTHRLLLCELLVKHFSMVLSLNLASSKECLFIRWVMLQAAQCHMEIVKDLHVSQEMRYSAERHEIYKRQLRKERDAVVNQQPFDADAFKSKPMLRLYAHRLAILRVVSVPEISVQNFLEWFASEVERPTVKKANKQPAKK